MYEAEVNDLTESIETLPHDIRTRFSEFRDEVIARTTLPWGEHCTECAWPVCYTTCELYSPRQDGACRQFVDGAVRIDHKGGLSPYLMKVRFRQWAKLWTVGSVNLKALPQAERQEYLNITIGTAARKMPLPATLKPRVLQKISYIRRQSAEKAAAPGTVPDYFLLECYNPNSRVVDLTFTVRPRGSEPGRPFQKKLQANPGYTRLTVEFAQISNSVDVARPFEVEIVPNECDNTVLYFGLMDFVKTRRKTQSELTPQTKAGKVKCIVWDLDNTLWDGTLVEDGPEKIRIRGSVLDIIKRTDERGILHSIASKNGHDDAMKVLRLHGIDEYFLYPQIAWRPKSQSIAQIAKLLNIGVDTLVFVDDQPFEREEVRSVLPQVNVIDAATCGDIPDRAEFQVPVTAESRTRRLMYREEQQREAVLESYNGDYSEFLKDCRIEVGLQRLDGSNLERVYELAQRTNQLNFSGNRYPREKLSEVMTTGNLATYVIDCVDRFGKYGIVGFAVVDTSVPRLLDLMFSCRVQGKRVEHAVLAFLLKRFIADKNHDFYANYRKTPKNAPGGRVFEELGFELKDEKEGVSSLVFSRQREIPDDGIITITERRAD